MVALIGGGVAAWQWRTHPTALQVGAAGMEIRLDTVPDTIYLGITSPNLDEEGTEITLRSVTPRFTTNQVRADTSFFVCTVLREGSGSTSLGSGGRRDFKETYPDAEPIEDGTKLHTGELQYVVAAVTARKPGRVSIDAFEFAYSHGLRSGTQTSEEDITIDVGRTQR